MDVDGLPIIDVIKDEIDGAEICVADISTLNLNALFEAGYAISRNKTVLFAVDDSDLDASSRVGEFRLVDTLGQARYAGQASLLATKVSELAFSHDGQPTSTDFLKNASSRQENAVFAPTAPGSFSANTNLKSHLERRTDLNIIGTDEDLGHTGLSYYFGQVYRCSASVLSAAVCWYRASGDVVLPVSG